MNAAHPDRTRLSSFALGRLGAADAQAVADHVSSCSACEATLAAVPDDVVLALIRLVVLGRSGEGGDTPLDQRYANTPSAAADSSGQTPSEPSVSTDVREVPAVTGYADLALVGEGGMGAVYRARDTRLKREVALKVLRHGGDEARDQRFRIEAEAVARLQHPHIVQIFEIGQWQPPRRTGPAPYLALEYVRGGSLDRVLQQGPLAVAEAAHLLEVLARAVQAAHDAGIVHRDLKPANVLLAEPVPGNSGSLGFGFPKIADFGLARRMDAEVRQTADGHMLGTPAYMAPEQADGLGAVGPAADVWALGVILYQCLTGMVPFKGPGLRVLLAQVCQAPPRPPHALRAEVPVELEAICLRCLEKDPARRHPSAAALADDLASFRADRPTHASTLGFPLPAGAFPADMPPTAVPDPGRRWALGVSLAALAVVVVLAGGLLGWRPWQTAPALPGPGATEPSTGKVSPPRPEGASMKGSLDVVVYESARAGTDTFETARQRQRLRLHERQALPLRPRDWIRIEATVTRPAYLYLIWIGTDGQATPVWPWRTSNAERPPAWTDPRGQETRRQRLTLPGDLNAALDVMPLGDGPPGLETLLLLARPAPLRDDEAAELVRLLAPRPRKQAKDLELAVWLENGERVTNEPDRAPLVGKGQDSGDVESQVRTVMRQIHERFGYVRGVCFGNQGKGKP